MLKPFFYLILLAFLFLQIISCHDGVRELTYEEQIQAWQSERLSELKDPYGWPSVIGLFWIRNSMQFFGKSPTNDFMLGDNAPSTFGRLEKYDDSIVMKVLPQWGVIVDSQKVSTVHMLNDKVAGGPTIASWKSLQWHVIKRQDKSFLRVKDTLSIYRQALHSIPYFPVDSNYRIKATFSKADITDTTTYENILGMTIISPVAGHVSFDHDGKSHRLTALANSEQDYFIIFADKTTGKDTYGGGRYLYPKKEDQDGIIVLDFNKAINPPCVFTPFATCPLPPAENHLAIAINAGEKYVKVY